MQRFDLRTRNYYNSNRFSNGIEYFQDTAFLASFRMRDAINESGDIPFAEAMLRQIAQKCNVLIQIKAHLLFSFKGLRVTNWKFSSRDL